MAKGYVDIAVLRDQIVILCRDHGVQDAVVEVADARLDRPREVFIQLVSRPDIDPTEESNAVSWANN